MGIVALFRGECEGLVFIWIVFLRLIINDNRENMSTLNSQYQSPGVRLPSKKRGGGVYLPKPPMNAPAYAGTAAIQ